MDGEEIVQNKNNSIVPGIVLGTLAIGIIGGGFSLLNKQPTNQFKNGNYSAIGNYTSPAGEEEVEIKLTIDNDLVTEASSDVRSANDKSQYWQKQFSDNFSKEIVGKKIGEVKLDRVSGSSLTPKGFNEAIEKIKSQSKG